MYMLLLANNDIMYTHDMVMGMDMIGIDCTCMLHILLIYS